MNEPNKRESIETEKPLSVEVDEQLLTMEDGRPSELHRLLVSLGCNIFPGTSSTKKYVTNENATLSELCTHSIRKYSEAYSRDDFLDRHERDVEAGNLTLQEKSDLMDDWDFISESGKLLPISMNDMLQFNGYMGKMRTGENGEVLRSKESSPMIRRYNAELERLYEKIGILLAMQKVGPTKKIDPLLFRKGNLSHVRDVLANEFQFKDKEPINNPQTLSLFAQIRTVQRMRNRLAGIDTISEMIRLQTADAIMANKPKPRGRGRKIQGPLFSPPV